MLSDPLPILQRGVVCALRQWNLHGHMEDFDDMVQEAYLYWLDHIQPGEDERPIRQQEGYCFYSAKFSTLRYLSRRARQWKAEQAALAAATWLDGGSGSESRCLHIDVAQELLAAFYGQRAKQGCRGAEAAIRDVAILDMVQQGYCDDGIALELGLAPASIKRYRNQIRRRLEHILSGNQSKLSAWTARKADPTKETINE